MKIVASLLLAAAVFAVAQVAGASGTSGARTCGEGRIGAAAEPTFHDGRYIVDDVRVGNLPAACAGDTVEVVLTGSGGELMRVTGVVPAGGGSLRLPTPRDVAAAAVAGVSVAIRS